MDRGSIRLGAVALAVVMATGLAGAALAGDARAEKASLTVAAVPPSDYRIGPQDTLEVDVFQVPELTRSVQVDSSGTILLPLIGKIPAAGMTPAELSQDVAARLQANYMKNPQVTISVKDASSRRVTIDGAVNQPGIYPLAGPTSLLQAVALAKGPDTKLANLHKVEVFRTVGGQRVGRIYDLAAIRSGKADDPEVQADDIVIVGTSGTRSLMRDLSGFPILSLFRPF